MVFYVTLVLSVLHPRNRVLHGRKRPVVSVIVASAVILNSRNFPLAVEMVSARSKLTLLLSSSSLHRTSGHSRLCLENLYRLLENIHYDFAVLH